jgi:tRNA(fMet)-specific endonuclease VapC
MEMNILLDTNFYSDFCKGDEQAVRAIQQARRIFLPFAVLAELRAGFLCGTKARKNERTLTLFLNSVRVEVLYPDENTTHQFAAVFAQLRLQGNPIPTNDIWIAALAVQHDLILCSRDKHFDLLPQLARVA